MAQKRFSVFVLETASALGEIGAGIQLGPNAFHTFDYLGVGQAARAMAVYIDQLRLMDALTGEEITHIDLGERFRARSKNPHAVVHRGDLHSVFLKACRVHERIALQVRSEVTSYEQDGSRVTVRLASGESVAGSALIGADGLWPNVRKQVVGEGPPRVSRHTTYRSVTAHRISAATTTTTTSSVAENRIRPHATDAARHDRELGRGRRVRRRRDGGSLPRARFLASWTIDQISSMGRVGNTIDRVEAATTAAFRGLGQKPLFGCAEQAALPRTGSPIHAARIGHVQHFDPARLQEIAAEHALECT